MGSQCLRNSAADNFETAELQLVAERQRDSQYVTTSNSFNSLQPEHRGK